MWKFSYSEDWLHQGNENEEEKRAKLSFKKLLFNFNDRKQFFVILINNIVRQSIFQVTVEFCQRSFIKFFQLSTREMIDDGFSF